MSSQSSITKPDPSRSAVVALGSNQAFEGSSPAQLVVAAAERLSQFSETQVQLSSLHRTAAQGLGSSAADFFFASSNSAPARAKAASRISYSIVKKSESEFVAVLRAKAKKRAPPVSVSQSNATTMVDQVFLFRF